MGVINATHSQRVSHQDERRRKEAEEAAAREQERTIADAEEHRAAVAGDAHADGRPQRVSPRHEGGALNTMAQPMDETSKHRPSKAPKDEAPKG